MLKLVRYKLKYSKIKILIDYKIEDVNQLLINVM